MYKGSENADRKSVLYSSSGGSIKRCLWRYTGGIVDLSKPQKVDKKDCFNWKFIAMIILHFYLHPQFKDELFRIFFTSEIWYLPRTNAVPAHLRRDTVKSYKNVRSLRGCMQYLTRWTGTALPNTSLGQTGVTNAASSQIKNSRSTPCSLPGNKKKWHQKIR